MSHQRREIRQSRKGLYNRHIFQHKIHFNQGERKRECAIWFQHCPLTIFKKKKKKNSFFLYIHIQAHSYDIIDERKSENSNNIHSASQSVSHILLLE